MMLWLLFFFGGGTYAASYHGYPYMAFLCCAVGMIWTHWLGVVRTVSSTLEKMNGPLWRPSPEPTPRPARRIINEECD